MHLKNLVSTTLAVGALFITTSCGPQTVSMQPTSQRGTSLASFDGRILACSRYDGSESSGKLAKRNNYRMALEEVEHKKRINRIKDFYPVNGQLCTVYDVD